MGGQTSCKHICVISSRITKVVEFRECITQVFLYVLSLIPKLNCSQQLHTPNVRVKPLHQSFTLSIFATAQVQTRTDRFASFVAQLKKSARCLLKVERLISENRKSSVRCMPTANERVSVYTKNVSSEAGFMLPSRLN